MAILLKLTTLSKENYQRDLHFLVDDLEAGLDSLNRLAGLGEHLTQIRFIDENGSILLPVGLVDGVSFSGPIHQLRKTWEQLLAQPTARQRVDNWRQREIIAPLLAIQNKRIDLLQNTLHQIHYLLESTQKQMRDGPKKTLLLEHYQGIIDRFNRSLAKATAKQHA